MGRKGRKPAVPKHPLLRSIGRRVQALRDDAGFSRSALGARAGLSPTTVAGIESAEVSPTIETLSKIATCLQVELTTLLDDAPPPPRPAAKTIAFHRVMARLRDRDVDYLRAAELLLKALDRATGLVRD